MLVEPFVQRLNHLGAEIVRASECQASAPSFEPLAKCLKVCDVPPDLSDEFRRVRSVFAGRRTPVGFFQLDRPLHILIQKKDQQILVLERRVLALQPSDALGTRVRLVWRYPTISVCHHNDNHLARRHVGEALRKRGAAARGEVLHHFRAQSNREHRVTRRQPVFFQILAGGGDKNGALSRHIRDYSLDVSRLLQGISHYLIVAKTRRSTSTTGCYLFSQVITSGP